MKKIIALISSALLLLALAWVTGVPVAFAHAEIQSCTPPIDGTVETAPDKVVCKTSQGMKVEGSSLKVFDANGSQVDKGDSAVDLNDPDRVTISVSLDTVRIQDGVYTVKWTTVSADDGDEASGEFKFTVGHAMDVNGTPTARAQDNSAVTHPNDDHSIGVATVNSKQVTLKIVAPADETTLPVGDVKIEATVEGVELGKDGLHLHFYVDDNLVAMGEGTQNTQTVNLTAGTHELMVALADEEHENLDNAHVHVTVGEAAASTATAVATEAAATPTAAPTQSAPTNTLPAAGESVNYGLFAMLAVFGLMLLGTGALVFVRMRR